jgi:hypothetical protein
MNSGVFLGIRSTVGLRVHIHSVGGLKGVEAPSNLVDAGDGKLVMIRGSVRNHTLCCRMCSARRHLMLILNSLINHKQKDSDGLAAPWQLLVRGSWFPQAGDGEVRIYLNIACVEVLTLSA